MPIPHDYVERVYAGVLGKIIGVYLGRPFEGWTHERIMAELGEIWYYVHEKLGKPLIVTDDDISGTFTFVRALADYGNRRDLSPVQIGQTWLNYLIEQRTILWWGGLGNSTEHTAYLRLKSGFTPPYSGSVALNGKVVAEQIGGQIFIDGWAMVAPGDPELAADLARRAASVSHDGEGIYGAQVLAAMESLAFVEADIDRLLDAGLSVIPTDSTIYRLINDIRAYHARQPDWRQARRWLEESDGYATYPGNCHIVPNHGLIILALLYGEGDFQRSLMIVNTGGWDTDCNSGNLGCLLGIRNGLAGLDAGPDWRGPVADRLYVAAADGSEVMTDAVRETYRLVNSGRALVGLDPISPKNGARFHFDLPGAVQGFRPENSPECNGVVTVANVPGHSSLGQRSLAVRYHRLAHGRAARIATPTFLPADALAMAGYNLMASPTLYPGQQVTARVEADHGNARTVTCGLYLRSYGPDDRLIMTRGPAYEMTPGRDVTFSWRVPEVGGGPIAEIGLELTGPSPADGTVYLDYLTWDSAPDATFAHPSFPGTAWRRAWVDGMDQAHYHPGREYFSCSQNSGRGLLITGTREWTDYMVSADVMSHLAQAVGLAARVQGMRRYYALLLCAGGKARLLKALDGDTVLAEADFPWQYNQTHVMSLQVQSRHIRASIDGQPLFDVHDRNAPLLGGGIALVCEEGRLVTSAVRVRPVAS